MTQTAIELYLYMGNSNAIIDWLKKEGVKTRQQAIDRLSPYVSSIFLSSMLTKGSSLANAANGSERILKAFPNGKK